MKQCPICQAKYDKSLKSFEVSFGPPISQEKFNSKVCHFANKRGAVGCINPCCGDNLDYSLSWDTTRELDTKSENLLRDIKIKEEDIENLKKKYDNRDK